MTGEIPMWLWEWFCARDTGMSSLTIAAALGGRDAAIYASGACSSFGFRPPYDTSDVGRCVRLLDLAAANGEDWRVRLGEVVAVCPEWAPLVSRWAEIEAAYREDVVKQDAWRRVKQPRRKADRIPRPPSRCWWLVSTLGGGCDPYSRVVPHPFGGGAA